MSNKPVILTEKLTKLNGKSPVFENVNLSIFNGEFVSIKGPSGCGKTTLLRILSGLLEPSNGKIYLSGKLANSPETVVPPYDRNIGLLFQELALWPHMTAHEQLEFVSEAISHIGEEETSSRRRSRNQKGFWMRSLASRSFAYQNDNYFKEKVEKLCQEIGLPEKLLTKYPSELSRGEQQRLAIVRTLMPAPKILLLDEPLTALDQELRNRFIKFLGRLKKERSTTVIIVSHDLMTDVVGYDQQFVFKNYSFVKT